MSITAMAYPHRSLCSMYVCTCVTVCLCVTFVPLYVARQLKILKTKSPILQIGISVVEWCRSRFSASNWPPREKNCWHCVICEYLVNGNRCGKHSLSSSRRKYGIRFPFCIYLHLTLAHSQNQISRSCTLRRRIYLIGYDRESITFIIEWRELF